MGQYYKPVCLKENKRTPKAWVYSHRYGNGLKLMEHSWIGNGFVEVVEHLLSPIGDWYKQPFVWAGDYADDDKGLKSNVYSRSKDSLEINPTTYQLMDNLRYIINHTKGLFVDKTKVPVSDTHEGFEYRIHPLPLLTCEGNGRGGGDFRGQSHLIGSWARNVISVDSEVPSGYQEIIFDLVEN